MVAPKQRKKWEGEGAGGRAEILFYGNLSVLILKTVIPKVGSQPQGFKVKVAEE